MEFIEIIKKRYAAKKFTGEMIPQDKIDQLLEMIKLSPSSFGLQQFKVKIVSDQQTKDKLLPLSYNQEQISTASHVLVFCAYTDVDKRIEQYESLMKEAKAPDEAIKGYIEYMKNFLKNVSKERIPEWTAKQAYIALGNAMNGATALGFDSCPMEGFDAKAYSKVLELPSDTIPVVVCPVGIAADEPKPKLRYADEELFI